ncbi:hypothetical protein TNCV_1519521 [Trichonephila clavipes]|nr:hypothetical protein TNCV_1519521 [Trichonephila clavipes]
MFFSDEKGECEGEKRKKHVKKASKRVYTKRCQNETKRFPYLIVPRKMVTAERGAIEDFPLSDCRLSSVQFLSTSNTSSHR